MALQIAHKMVVAQWQKNDAGELVRADHRAC